MLNITIKTIRTIKIHTIPATVVNFNEEIFLSKFNGNIITTHPIINQLETKIIIIKEINQE